MLSYIKIKGFINIESKKYERICRRYLRGELEDLWGDSDWIKETVPPEVLDDIFCLRRLFGMEPYEESIPFGAEDWNDIIEPPTKRLRIDCEYTYFNV